MTRRTFFTYQYGPDIWRANVVRNSWVTQDREASGFWDASLWEKAKRNDENSLKRLMRDGIKNTSVTIVLAGANTYKRRWVRYEIVHSVISGNGLMNLHISKIKDQDENTADNGQNPLAYVGLKNTGTGLGFVEKRGDKWYDYPDYTRQINYYDIPGDPPGKDKLLPLSHWFTRSYAWNRDDGYDNLGDWIEAAAQDVGR